MLNSTARREAVQAPEAAVAEHQAHRQRTTAASDELFDRRRRAADEVIVRVEDYVNRFAHSPKRFDKSVKSDRVEVGRFDDRVHRRARARRNPARERSAAPAPTRRRRRTEAA